jgi:chromosome partitioning protein
MPIIITVAHQKGGVGKSTLAINLTSYFAQTGANCAIVDADAQGSISNLISTFGEGNTYGDIKLVRRNDFKNFKDIAILDYKLLVVDTPPYLSTNLNEIFSISDFVLVPAKAAVFDILALDGTINLINQAKQINNNLKAGIVINMLINGSSFGKDIRQHLNKKSIPVLKTEIGNRIEFSRCLLNSNSIFSGKDKKAKDEISGLGDEILSIIHKRSNKSKK